MVVQVRFGLQPLFALRREVASVRRGKAERVEGFLSATEEHARTALEHLESGGQWTDMLPEEVLLSVAHALLAEILRRRLEEDAVIFGDPAEFKALLAESKTHFARARELDPTDETSSYYAFFLGPEGHGSKDEGGAAAQPTSDEPFEN